MRRRTAGRPGRPGGIRAARQDLDRVPAAGSAGAHRGDEADGDQRADRSVAWGQVHDGNAFALGGISGHAGLFGTAEDLGRFASALLTADRHPVLNAERRWCS
jgi:CubicO group peptidase (beta-lactamase class C family)